MRKEVVVSSSAKKDTAKLKAYIKHKLKMHGTSAGYMKGLDDAIEKLSYLADSVGRNEYVQKMFGANARHIIYKKMAIIFFVEDETVYVIRIITC